MCWLNEFDWFLLFLLMMKLGVLWAVAACVAAVDLTCEEYCTCLSSGIRDVEYRPDCECAQTSFQHKFDDSGIYYEPAGYHSLPALIYNQPFYIINPVLQLQRKRSTNATQRLINIERGKTQQIPYRSDFSAVIGTNSDTIRLSHNRKEKDIQADYKKTSTPLYLDINIRQDNERSASTNIISAQNLKKTEKTLSECADLYTLLYYRKNQDINRLNIRNPNQLNKYEHLSNKDLIKAIDETCSHISYIVQESLNEIKEKRPKKANNKFKINSEYEENNDLEHSMKTSNAQNYNVDMATEADFHSPVHFYKDANRKLEDSDANKDDIVVIYTQSPPDDNTDKIYMAPTPIASAADASRTTPITESVPVTSSRKDAQHVYNISTEIYPSIKPVYVKNEYPFSTESSLLHTTYKTADFSIPITRNEEQDRAKHLSDDEVTTMADTEEYNEHRKHYNDEDVPLVQIISREFSNDTVQSYINGTEDIPNGDFINVDPKNLNYNNTKSTTIEATDRDGNNASFEPDVRGNLYLLVDQEQIPARFVQQPNGTLHVGIDALTICNKLDQGKENRSKLLSTLCNCYKSGNCPT